MSTKSNIISTCLVIFFTFLLFSTVIMSCKSYVRNSAHAAISATSIHNGEVLAERYCQSCHLLPEPMSLDTKSWESVLPQMGPRLGIFKSGFQNYPFLRHDPFLDSNYYPRQPLLGPDEWQDIVNYYRATSPDSLPPQKRAHQLQTGLSLFSVHTPVVFNENAATSYVKIVPGNTLHPLIVSDAIKQEIYFINKELQSTDSVHIRGSVVDIDFLEQRMLALNIGQLNPNNGKFGKVQFLDINSHNKMQTDTTAIDQLQRPVQLTSADLNKDGNQDLLICEFGFLTGSLSWMENRGNNGYIRHVLRPVAGAIKAFVDDFNHDGLPDIWVLFSQGEEGIFLFTNKGKGNFDQREVLRFPPVNGSSYFELADFNKDGYPDILYTCGDNADYSIVFKPYHGVYIFMNDKTNHFYQKYFFPVNGCYKAMARDFDNDGDLDIAAISFFADYAHQPDEGFVYLKNNGNFNFLPYTLEAGKAGRWLVMDAGDIDGDEKIDIVLGNFSIKASLNKSTTDWKKSPPFIILKNTGK